MDTTHRTRLHRLSPSSIALGLLAVTAGATLHGAVDTCRGLFVGLGADVPLPTELVMAVPPKAWALAGAVVGILAIFKDVAVPPGSARDRFNLPIALGVLAVLCAVLLSVFVPLHDLVQAIG